MSCDAFERKDLSVFGEPESQGIIESKLNAFLGHDVAKGERIVLITSGGTSVPLEKHAVRSIENFSTGRRGAISAEYFLRNGYKVIYLHRENCFLPFIRILETEFNEREVENLFTNLNGALQLRKPVPDRFERAYTEHQKYRSDFLLLSFTTLSQYMHSLFTICSVLKKHGKNVMLYLAAAVSDYYVPLDEIPTHKIQSSSNRIVLSLEPVPKMLTYVVGNWVPEAYVVTFKLETDSEILDRKATNALKKYKHQAVVANLMHTRYTNVKIFTQSRTFSFDITKEDFEKGKEIEDNIVQNLVSYHKVFIGV